MKEYQANVYCEYIYGLQITNNRVDRVIFSNEFLKNYTQKFSVLTITEFKRLVEQWESTNLHEEWNSISEQERQERLKPNRKRKRTGTTRAVEAKPKKKTR